VVRLAFERMNTDLGRRKPEDEPAVAAVDVAPPQDVAEGSAQGFGFRAVEQDVRAGDRHAASGYATPPDTPGIT
jgi:hypothetical protein